MTRLVARARVPLGFAVSALSLAIVKPTWWSWIAGGIIALSGELLRLWAAGHLQKSREITRSGPYRHLRHPLYTGSALMALGFVIASRSWFIGGLAAAYLGLTLWAAVKTEEASLDTKFAGEYSAYRDGTLEGSDRPFSWRLVRLNREYRAASGVILVFSYLAVRILISSAH